MAHPKLTTVVHRSLLAAGTVALLAGPFAAVGAAGTLDGVTDALDLTCEEAFETEKAALIDEFCTAEELEELTSPLTKSVDEVTKTVDGTKTTVEDTVNKQTDDGGEDAEGSPDPTDEVLPDDGKTGGKGGTKVEGAGETPTSLEEGTTSGTAGAKPGKNVTTSGTRVEAQGYGYNTDGPFRPGMRSNSSLTLQPFAAPLVSVPPVYELPQVAQQLFGTTTTGASAADPQVATAGGYSPTGASSTSADPTGWLAATATGLIMLVGAGHALNGGRNPSRRKA